MTKLFEDSDDRYSVTIDDNGAFTRKLVGAFNHYQPAARDRRVAKLLTTAARVDGHAPMSNGKVRKTVEDVLAAAVLADFRDNPVAQLGRRHFLLTVAPDEGNMLMSSPVMPFGRMQRKVNRTLKALGLNGLCIFEFDTLVKRLDGDADRLILGHTHGLVWTYDHDFQAQKVSKTISGTRAYYNRVGIPGFDLTSRAESSARRRAGRDRPELDQTEESMRYLVHYMMKCRACAKDRWIDDDGKPQVDYDFDHFSYRDAIRISELQSYLTPQTFIFGVGDGENIVREYRKAIRRALPVTTRDSDWLHREGVETFWRRYLAHLDHPGWVPAVVD